MSEKNFNNLKPWLYRKLEERRLTIDQLAIKARISRTVMYMWMSDEARPTTKSAAKVVHYLSSVPVWKEVKGEWIETQEEIPLEEMLQQYTENKVGRPKGSGSTMAVTARGRR